jgi:hypothetical protein
MITKQPSTKKYRIIYVVILFLVVLCGSLGYLYWKNQQTNVSDNTETTSRQPSAQSTFTGAGKKEIVQSNSNEGVVTDTGGTISTLPPSSDWSSSTSGVITVYSPAKNSLLSSGQTLSGKSSAGRVSFRLMDSISGVIAQGSISVVNDKFSGTFSFATSAKDGRLDLFTTDSNGVESNGVEIPVRFN